MTAPFSNPSLPGMLEFLPALAFLAKATLLLLLAVAGAAALRRTSAGARHIVWCGALAGLVLLPVLSWWAPWRLEVLPSRLTVLSGAQTSLAAVTGHELGEGSRPAGETPAAPPNLDPLAERLPQRPFPQSLPEHVDQQAAALDSHVASHAAPHDLGAPSIVSGTANLSTVWLALLALWMIGAVIFLARLIAGAIAVRRIVHGAQSLGTRGWMVPLWEVADRLDLSRVPRLLLSDRVSMPFACGLFHPAIVLPREAHGWSDARRRAVLFHELAHVRRRDLIGHTLGRVTCALYWFHPLVWTAARRLRAEAERACDDLVLATGTRASEYADHLLQILTAVRNAPAPTAALAMARRKEFEGRMLAILDPEVRRGAPGRLQSAALVFGLVALAVSVSAMAPAAAPAARQSERLVQGADTARSARTTTAPAVQGEHEKVSAIDSGIGGADTIMPPRTNSGQLPAAAERSLGLLNQAVASADTGEHLAGAISDMVGTIVGSVVPSVVDATVGKAMRYSSSDLADGWYDGWYVDADAIADRSVAAVQRAIQKSVRASGDAWLSSGRTHADSATTLLLVQLLQYDSAVSVRKTAAWALAQRGGHGASSRLCKWSSDCTARVKALTVMASSKLCALSTNCSDGTRARRDRSTDEQRASTAQMRRQDSTVTAALAAALEHDRSTDVREMAAWGLSRSEGSVAIQALGDAVQRDDDAQVKTTAAWALGEIGDSSAAPALDGALADPSATVRARAAWALGRIEPRTAPHNLTNALGDSEMQVRLMAAWALGQIADSTTLSALSTALSTEKDHKVREAELRAVFVLGQHSDAALRELLKSPDPKIRVRATRALAGYGLGAWPMPMPMPMPRPMP